jgi:DNA-directed RNA polymerase subunit K/omega
MSDSEDDEIIPEEVEDAETADEDEDDEDEEEDCFVDEVDAWNDEAQVSANPSRDCDTRFDVPQLQQYIQKHHPEIKAYTYDVMGEQMKKENKTLNFLSKFEITSALGFRTLQLNKGAEPLIETDLTDSYQIAKKELELGMIPFIIRRPLPDGTFVHIRMSELSIL